MGVGGEGVAGMPITDSGKKYSIKIKINERMPLYIAAQDTVQCRKLAIAWYTIDSLHAVQDTYKLEHDAFVSQLQ